MIVELELKDLQIPQGLLPRVITGTVEEKVEEYKEMVENGTDFDPILVWKRPDGSYWIIDGVHRTEAYKRAGRATIKAKLVDCKDELDYRIKAIEANLKHGLPLRKEEKVILAQTLYKLGIDIPELTKIFAVSQRTMYYWLRSMKGQEKEELKKQALELRAQGLTAREVGEKLGLEHTTIIRWENELGAKLQNLQKCTKPSEPTQPPSEPLEPEPSKPSEPSPTPEDDIEKKLQDLLAGRLPLDEEEEQEEEDEILADYKPEPRKRDEPVFPPEPEPEDWPYPVQVPEHLRERFVKDKEFRLRMMAEIDLFRLSRGKPPLFKEWIEQKEGENYEEVLERFKRKNKGGRPPKERPPLDDEGQLDWFFNDIYGKILHITIAWDWYIAERFLLKLIKKFVDTRLISVRGKGCKEKGVLGVFIQNVDPSLYESYFYPEWWEERYGKFNKGGK
jgi:ParB-like chromosome segregation protein Spo0J